MIWYIFFFLSYSISFVTISVHSHLVSFFCSTVVTFLFCMKILLAAIYMFFFFSFRYSYIITERKEKQIQKFEMLMYVPHYAVGKYGICVSCYCFGIHRSHAGKSHMSIKLIINIL